MKPQPIPRPALGPPVPLVAVAERGLGSIDDIGSQWRLVAERDPEGRWDYLGDWTAALHALVRTGIESGHILAVTHMREDRSRGLYLKLARYPRPAELLRRGDVRAPGVGW